MINILYFSVALIAIAFVILVIYVAKTLKSLTGTLNHVSNTLVGLEKQVDDVTKETTILLHRTNELASDIQQKAESLNNVVDAVKEVGDTVRKFNGSLQSISTSVNQQLENNKDKMANVVQLGQIIFELKDKWDERKQKKYSIQREEY